MHAGALSWPSQDRLIADELKGNALLSPGNQERPCILTVLTRLIILVEKYRCGQTVLSSGVPERLKGSRTILSLLCRSPYLASERGTVAGTATRMSFTTQKSGSLGQCPWERGESSVPLTRRDWPPRGSFCFCFTFSSAPVATTHIRLASEHVASRPTPGPLSTRGPRRSCRLPTALRTAGRSVPMQNCQSLLTQTAY